MTLRPPPRLPVHSGEAPREALGSPPGKDPDLFKMETEGEALLGEGTNFCHAPRCLGVCCNSPPSLLNRLLLRDASTRGDMSKVDMAVPDAVGTSAALFLAGGDKDVFSASSFFMDISKSRAPREPMGKLPRRPPATPPLEDLEAKSPVNGRGKAEENFKLTLVSGFFKTGLDSCKPASSI